MMNTYKVRKKDMLKMPKQLGYCFVSKTIQIQFSFFILILNHQNPPPPTQREAKMCT